MYGGGKFLKLSRLSHVSGGCKFEKLKEKDRVLLVLVAFTGYGVDSKAVFRKRFAFFADVIRPARGNGAFWSNIGLWVLALPISEAMCGGDNMKAGSHSVSKKEVAKVAFKTEKLGTSC